MKKDFSSARAAAPSLCAGKHFTIGVTNSQMKSLRCNSSGQKWWIMLKKSPLICDPSWSWSVMSITLPYLVHSKHRMYQVMISCYPPQALQLSVLAWQSVSVRLDFFRGDAERYAYRDPQSPVRPPTASRIVGARR